MTVFILTGKDMCRPSPLYMVCVVLLHCICKLTYPHHSAILKVQNLASDKILFHPDLFSNKYRKKCQRELKNLALTPLSVK